MPRAQASNDESTPAGHLAETGLHGLLGYQLAQARIATNRVFKAQAGNAFSLRPVEYTVLSLIKENPGVSPARLAKGLAVTAPNITMWLGRLEQRGLVQRRPSATDGRSHALHVSPQGANIAATATRRLREGERTAFAHLSAGEHQILIELLHKLARR